MLINFNEAKHEYSLDGEIIPGVTTIINDLYTPGPDDEAMEIARDRGTKVHKACELYDLNVLDLEDLDPVLQPYLNAWIQFRSDTGVSIIEIERLVYHPKFRYAGKLDRVAMLNGKISVIDIKSSTVMLKLTGLQLAAYQAAYNASIAGTDLPEATERYGLQLRADGKYRLVPYTDKTEFNVFIGCLNRYNWRLKYAK